MGQKQRRRRPEWSARVSRGSHACSSSRRRRCVLLHPSSRHPRAAPIGHTVDVRETRQGERSQAVPDRDRRIDDTPGGRCTTSHHPPGGSPRGNRRQPIPDLPCALDQMAADACVVVCVLDGDTVWPKRWSPSSPGSRRVQAYTALLDGLHGGGPAPFGCPTSADNPRCSGCAVAGRVRATCRVGRGSRGNVAGRVVTTTAEGHIPRVASLTDSHNDNIDVTPDSAVHTRSSLSSEIL